MNRHILFFTAFLCFAIQLPAQTEPNAGNWKTWLIESGNAYRLPHPPSNKEEVAQVLSRQKNLDAEGLRQIIYWNAGSPGYRWQNMMGQTWMSDALNNGILANMLLNTAVYDATIAAWNTKYAYKRPRPFEVNSKIKCLVPKPESPSYPCDYSVAAGVSATIIAHFFPSMADSVNRMAEEVMASRIAAGVAFPKDTRDGFELGKRIA
jgi:membrane-associated phospholipid phosphatase